MEIELSEDLQHYKESIAMGLNAKQLIWRLCEMLLRIKLLFCEDRVHTQAADKYIALLFFFVRLCVNGSEAFEHQLGR